MTNEAEPMRAIIIVEDEPDILYIMRGLLRELAKGYDIIGVSTSAKALERIADRDVALVITDYHMPEMNGIELAASIQRHTPHIPVIMVTAYANARLEKQAAAYGVRAFLAKPFALESLKTALAEALPQ
jgi:CheY-like chemotaxis protein